MQFVIVKNKVGVRIKGLGIRVSVSFFDFAQDDTSIVKRP